MMWIFATTVLFFLLMWIVSIILSVDVVPILSGQRWDIPGVGPVTIVKTLPAGSTLTQDPGKGMDVVYYTESGHVGFCIKSDIRSGGKLLAYDKSAVGTVFDRINRQVEIEQLLEIMRQKRTELGIGTYKPPKGWQRPPPGPKVSIVESKEPGSQKQSGPIIEAEVIYPDQFNQALIKKTK